MTRYYICGCDSTSRTIVVYVLYGIKGLLQIIALIFAFSIRKVNVKGLDDSKFVIASVYVGNIGLLIGLVGSYGMNNYDNSTIVTFTAFLIATTSILLLMFMPKVKHITSQLFKSFEI